MNSTQHRVHHTKCERTMDDGWMNEWMDEWMDVFCDLFLMNEKYSSIHTFSRWMHGWMCFRDLFSYVVFTRQRGTWKYIIFARQYFNLKIFVILIGVVPSHRKVYRSILRHVVITWKEASCRSRFFFFFSFLRSVLGPLSSFF